MASPKYSFNWGDAYKVLIGAIKPTALALSAYLLTIGPTIDQTTGMGLIISTLLIVGADAIKKFYSDTTAPPTPPVMNRRA